MKYGVVLPQLDIGEDPGGLREYAQAAEDLGYDYILAYDHVLGVDTSTRPDWSGPYTHESLFHEPMVMYGFLAGITKRVELVTGILILPQRQTVLVAKQAAEVDVLSGGRLRLGIGIGWNAVEYEGLNENFYNRGKRSEEQVEVLRQLWSKPVVNFEGRWHKISGAGLNPLPVQRPIPIWFGGGRTDGVLRRIAKLGDGWMPQMRPDADGEVLIERFRTFVAESGREPSSVGLDARVSVADGMSTAVESATMWGNLGADYVGVNTMKAGFTTLNQHISALREFKEAVD